MMKADTKIYENIMDKLKFATPNLRAEHITLSVDNGLVTLSGSVHSFLEKKITEKVVKNIYGVKGVANDIKVHFFTEDDCAKDTDLLSAASKAIELNWQIPYKAVQVVVRDGAIELTGEVDWWYQRNLAYKAVSKLRGVKKIDNLIKIKTSVSAKNVKDEITKEFHRNAQIDAQKINVLIENGNEVILKGKVASFAEIEEAERAAESIEGVAIVKNELRIA